VRHQCNRHLVLRTSPLCNPRNSLQATRVISLLGNHRYNLRYSHRAIRR
jgi:hypothetical protein